MMSAFLIRKYYATALFKVLKPTEYTKIKRPHVHINMLTLRHKIKGTLIQIKDFLKENTCNNRI